MTDDAKPARQKQVGRMREGVPRANRRLRLQTESKTIRMTKANWDLVDRNRIPMQLSQSQYVAYCVRKVAAPYDQKRAQAMADAARDDEA